MRRREFLTVIGGGVAALPHVTRAQQGPTRKIGFLGVSNPAAQKEWTAAFVQRLRELGWIEGQNLVIEYRWAEGRTERFAPIVAEFISLNVNAIVTAGTAATLAAKRATTTIAVVFATAGDPVATGLVASLPRPGGNVTGLSNQAHDLAAKRMEIMREMLPGFGRLAILANIGSPLAVLQAAEAKATAVKLGIEAATLEIKVSDDIAPAFSDVTKRRSQALYVVNEPLTFNHRARIAELALQARVPTMHDIREHVDAGGLLSYGPNFPDLYRRAAVHIDKILRGLKPADIPVEQPTKFDLIINVKTAKALGVNTPPMLLARADEVIE
jgi:putative tryptophan/tyrosine transport system substrate-binding protein